MPYSLASFRDDWRKRRALKSEPKMTASTVNTIVMTLYGILRSGRGRVTTVGGAYT